MQIYRVAAIEDTSKTAVKEFRKDIDDTNTQAFVIQLNKLMMSCAAVIFNNKVIGTAFRVGPKYVMTAFHVIRPIMKGLNFIFLSCY